MGPLALFDLDNTLVDRVTAFKRWAEWFAPLHGLGPEGVAWLREADDDGFADRTVLFEAARRQFGLTQSVEDLVDDYRRDYPTFFEPATEAIGPLQRMRQEGWRIGVITNGPPSQHDKLYRSGLTDLVDGVCVSDEVGWAKPDGRIFAEAIARCGGRGGRSVWMVGDAAVPDIQGGRDAGCRTIWLNRGRPWTADGFAPDVIVGSLSEAFGVLLESLPDGARVPGSAGTPT